MKSLRKYLGMGWMVLALFVASCGSPTSTSVEVRAGEFYCHHCRMYHPYSHVHYHTYHYDRYPPSGGRVVIEAPLPPPPPLP